MALRTTFTGPKEWRPRRNAAETVGEKVEGAGAQAGESVDRVRHSKRVQGRSPSFPSLPSPVRRRRGEGRGDGQPEGARGGDDGESSSSSSRSVISHTTSRSSRSSEHRRRLEAKARAQEELDEIEEHEEELMRKRLQRKRENVQRRLELELSSISGDDIPSLSNASLPSQLESSRDRVTSWLTKSGSFSEKSEQHCRETVQMRESTPISCPKDINTKYGREAAPRVDASRGCPCAHRKPTDEATDAVGPHRCGSELMLQKMISRQAVPKELPIFNGDVSEWPMFIAQYRRTTDLLGLSDDENLVRLQKCLRGKARDAVLPILSLPDNVSQVIRSLELMFGRADQVIKVLVQKVKDVESPKENKPESIILFSNLVANLVATILSLKKIGHMTNPTLMEELVGKLPCQMQLRWFTVVFNREGDPTLEDFSVWLAQQAMIVSLMSSKMTYNEQKKSDPNQQAKSKPKTVLNVTETKSTSCVCCKGAEHKMTECPEFKAKTVKLRWEFAIPNRLCLGCLKKGHRLESCSEKKKCGVDGCEKIHHRMLHRTYPKKGSSDVGSKDGADDGEKTFVGHTSGDGARAVVSLRVLPVVLTGPKGKVSTYALLDEGSTLTMMDAKIANAVGADGPIDPLCIQWTSGVEREEAMSKRVSIGISSGKERAKHFSLRNVRTIEGLSLPIHSIDMEKVRSEWTHLADVDFASINMQRPMILLGQDNILLTAPSKLLRGPWNAPVATRTPLGWVVHGNIPTGVRSSEPVVMMHACNNDDELTRIVKDSFSTENFGVKVTNKPMRSIEDENAYKILEGTTKRIGDRFETGLLWKDDAVLPESKSAALRRLHCIERKMDKDPVFATKYSEKLEDFIRKGYARELLPEELMVESPHTWYLPHFAHMNPNKPDKLRLIFDAASKSRGVSLNGSLMKGPDLLNSLPAILWRFREDPIGGAGDVEEMFPQIKIIPEDQVAQRFLWRGMNRADPPKEFVMTSMVFGSASSPSSANYVKNKNAEEFKNEFPDVYDAVLKQSFMDDHLDHGVDAQKFAAHILNVIEVYGRGGFRIRNWVSNSKEVLEKIDPAFRAKGYVDLSIQSELTSERILGLMWRTSTDEFYFQLKFHKVPQEIVDGLKIPTKREMLSLMMSIYDPLGFLAPLIIKVRILFQCVWRTGLGWDDQLTQQFHKIWTKWLELLKQVDDFAISRCYHPELWKAQNVQLHLFCDASQDAFACVAYLVFDTDEGICTAFVAAKAKVAPLKPLSIPKLELQAAILGTRLALTIKSELNVKVAATHYWSDSKTVLSWIRSDARQYKQFVSHRVGEIFETTDVTEWHWVPTENNVADEATRAGENCDLSKSSRWLCGPAFLKIGEDHWPKESVPVPKTHEEFRSDYVLLVINASPIEFEVLPDVGRFSRWRRLVRSTAYVYRTVRCRFGLLTDERQLHVSDIDFAEKIWWQKVQYDSFFDEVKLLKRGRELEMRSRLYKLGVYLDGDGVIRVQGRISVSDSLTFDAKHPVVLDPKHRYSELMLQFYHEKAGHQGIEAVINEIRQRFLIPGLRSAVKKTFNSCPVCCIRKARPTQPPMGSLPAVRVDRPSGPFTHVGMDYFGPFWVKVRRAKEKRYGVIFTCLATRAVHLEIAYSLSTDSAINAVRRCISRRRQPLLIFSDNGTNFKGASRELKEALRDLDTERLMSNLVERGIEWSFIPPSSPHMGGSWERLIKSVKVALSSTLNQRFPTDEVLLTLFAEAENIVNSRPLTYVSVDPDDPESLTPNHILKLENLDGGPPGLFQDNDLRLRRQWRFAQRLSDHFWNRWVKEYLPSLNRQAKWFRKVDPLKVGDVVVIADNNLPRCTWPLGIIERIFPDKNDHVRVADVRTAHGTYRRPAVKICKLDVRKPDEKESFHGGKICCGGNDDDDS